MPYSESYKYLIQGEKTIHQYFDADDDFIWPNMKRKFDKFLRQNGYKLIDLTRYRHDKDYRGVVDNAYIRNLYFIKHEKKVVYYDDEIQAYSLFNKGDENQFTLRWLWIEEPFENYLLAFNPPKECIDCQWPSAIHECRECGCKICAKCWNDYQDPNLHFGSYRHSWQCRACKNRNLFSSK